MHMQRIYTQIQKIFWQLQMNKFYKVNELSMKDVEE
jgi:hypothetical protein